MCVYFHQNMCSKIFLAALFIITPNWTLLKNPSTIEWIKKNWIFTQLNTIQQWEWAFYSHVPQYLRNVGEQDRKTYSFVFGFAYSISCLWNANLHKIIENLQIILLGQLHISGNGKENLQKKLRLSMGH